MCDMCHRRTTEQQQPHQQRGGICSQENDYDGGAEAARSGVSARQAALSVPDREFCDEAQDPVRVVFACAAPPPSSTSCFPGHVCLPGCVPDLRWSCGCLMLLLWLLFLFVLLLLLLSHVVVVVVLFHVSVVVWDSRVLCVFRVDVIVSCDVPLFMCVSVG